jgi:phosphatidylinositol glycan class S
MNGDPTNVTVDWELGDAVERYLKPFLNEIKYVSNFTVDSQIQHYATLTMKPKLQNSENASYYYLSPDSLPHFINSAEWNLASAVSSYPTINFIVYVPSISETPLRINNSKDEPIESNAFLIPRWGGIIISNPPLASENLTHHFSTNDLLPMMEIFISQLRGLLGVTNLQKEVGKGVYFTPALIRGITTLELDMLVRQRAVENVVDAVGTISSLAKLVDEIPNMVVLDHIQAEIYQALSSLQQSCLALRSGVYSAALDHSIRAIKRAEQAFFDPTMVSMLYFPDEHKYAIYMPLFVPISVPLVMVVMKEVRAVREKRAKLKAE